MNKLRILNHEQYCCRETLFGFSLEIAFCYYMASLVMLIEAGETLMTAALGIGDIFYLTDVEYGK